MSGVWREDHKDAFVRDLLRDVCKVHSIIHEQWERFSHSGTVSYAVLNNLLGESMRKGLFWHLKDTAHHLFRKGHKDGLLDRYPSEQIYQSLLDWCIGYTFHECVKLREDAFQQQHYGNRLLQIKNKALECPAIVAELEPYTQQTAQSMQREIERIVSGFTRIKALLLEYLKQHGNNGYVARLLIVEEKLVKECFAEQWPDLLQNLYGNNIVTLLCLACETSCANGRMDEARELYERALKEKATMNSDTAHDTNQERLHSLGLVFEAE